MIAGLRPARGTIAAVSDQAAAPPADRSYLRLLMVLLGTATFFEGYDTGIAAVVIPDLARDFHVANDLLGSPVSIVNLGALFALFVIAIGHRVVRRPAADPVAGEPAVARGEGTGRAPSPDAGPPRPRRGLPAAVARRERHALLLQLRGAVRGRLLDPVRPQRTGPTGQQRQRLPRRG